MFAEGAAFFDRAAAGVPPAVRARSRHTQRCRARAGERRVAAGGPLAAGHLAAGPRRPRSVPGARADHVVGDVPGVGRPDARAVRQLVRVLPALARVRRTTRRPGSGRLRHLPDSGHSGSRRSRRWASTSSTCRRSTRSATRSARARTTPSTRSRRPGFAVGDRLRGRRPRRDPPGARHLRGLRVLRRPGARGRPRGRDRPRPAGVAGPPVGEGPPEVVRRSAPTARSRTPRTRRRSTRTSTRSTSTTTPRASTPRCCGSSEAVDLHGVTVFRVDNPHTKPVNFWEYLLGEIRKTDPDVVFLSEAFTRRPMMRELAKVGFHQSLHLLHLAQREVGARGVPARSSPRRPGTSCGRTSS